jgi:hypothetical protein
VSPQAGLLAAPQVVRLISPRVPEKLSAELTPPKVEKTPKMAQIERAASTARTQQIQAVQIRIEKIGSSQQKVAMIRSSRERRKRSTQPLPPRLRWQS